MTVAGPGPDLVAAADDLRTPGASVGGGDRRSIRAEIRNDGGVAADGGFTFTLQLGEGAGFVERHRDCTYTDHWPDDDGGPWVYGPSEVTCTVAAPLGAHETLALAG